MQQTTEIWHDQKLTQNITKLNLCYKNSRSALTNGRANTKTSGTRGRSSEEQAQSRKTAEMLNSILRNLDLDSSVAPHAQTSPPNTSSVLGAHRLTRVAQCIFTAAILCGLDQYRQLP